VAQSFFFEEERYEGNMAGVHGLDGEPLCVDLNVDHFHKLFEGIDYLPEDGALI
jgi:hypothetical protein